MQQQVQKLMLRSYLSDLRVSLEAPFIEKGAAFKPPKLSQTSVDTCIYDLRDVAIYSSECTARKDMMIID
jgi:hypothetical protein